MMECMIKTKQLACDMPCKLRLPTVILNYQKLTFYRGRGGKLPLKAINKSATRAEQLHKDPSKNSKLSMTQWDV